MLETQNAVAVITGGASGIGLATARYWLQQGGKVVIGDISEEALAQAVKTLEGDVVSVVVDVTREADCGRLAAQAIEAFGRIDLVAPFAGIIMDGLLVATDRETGKVKGKMSLEKFQRVVDINLTGVFLTVRECLEQILGDVPIGRLIEPEEVASLACEIFRNEALTGEVFYIHGGLRLGSRG